MPHESDYGTLGIVFDGVINNPLTIVDAVKSPGFAIAEILTENDRVTQFATLMIGALEIDVAIEGIAVLTGEQSVARLIIEELEKITSLGCRIGVDRGLSHGSRQGESSDGSCKYLVHTCLYL